MTAKERKTLQEVLSVLHTAEARLRGIPAEALEYPDFVFATATTIMHALQSATRAHRRANIEAHTLCR